MAFVSNKVFVEIDAAGLAAFGGVRISNKCLFLQNFGTKETGKELIWHCVYCNHLRVLLISKMSSTNKEQVQLHLK